MLLRVKTKENLENGSLQIMIFQNLDPLKKFQIPLFEVFLTEILGTGAKDNFYIKLTEDFLFRFLFLKWHSVFLRFYENITTVRKI